MAKSDYFPRPDGELLVWHDRFKTNILPKLNELGLSDTDLADLEQDNQELHTKIAASNVAAAAARHATAEKAASRTLIENRVRAMVRRIKAHPKYTEAIGTLLGIIGTEINNDLTDAKPALNAVDHTGGIIELSFQKYTSDGVNIYSQRGDETEFTFLARSLLPHYTDKRPLLLQGKPELRRYTAVYVVKDSEVGQFSDELVMNCAP